MTTALAATMGLPARRSLFGFAATGSTNHPPARASSHGSERTGNELHLRTLFVVEPGLEGTVRQRIESALAAGRLVRPIDIVTTWRLHSCQRASVQPAERQHAGRLLRS